MPLFSVIIPVYNSALYLLDCIQSVLKQTFKNVEIILVDDCSTDSSGEMCDSLGKQEKSIRVVHNKENCGVSASRNIGIKAACGKYIIFLDSDDCLFEGCLQDISELIEKNPETDLIIGKYISQRYKQRSQNGSAQGFTTFDNTAIDHDSPDGVIGYIENFSFFSGVCWRYVINHNFIIENELYFVQAKIYEDEEFVARLLCLARKFAFYDSYLYWYRQRSQSLTQLITHANDYGVSRGCLEVANGICRFIKNNDLPDLKKEFLYTRIKNSLKILNGHLFTYGRKDIHEFSKMIESHIDNLKILKNGSHDFGMLFFIRTFGAFYGLLLYRAFITEKTISLVKDSDKRELYVFCVDLFGRVTAQILQNEGYPVQGFLDNNKGLEGAVVSGLNVFMPSVLSDKSKGKLSDVFVIVCHQHKNVFEKISDQLEEIGLEKEQIAHKIF